MFPQSSIFLSPCFFYTFLKCLPCLMYSILKYPVAAVQINLLCLKKEGLSKSVTCCPHAESVHGSHTVSLADIFHFLKPFSKNPSSSTQQHLSIIHSENNNIVAPAMSTSMYSFLVTLFQRQK